MATSLSYHEHTSPEVTHIWNNIKSIKSMITKRGTNVQMIERPNWGVACYMDNTIQSCEVDERLYHEALVHPAMASSYKNKRVLIVGGGEGATLREVLKWPDIEQVDMYEWDEDVVNLFKTSYPQWAKGAWNDTRLTLYHEDVFEAIKNHPSKCYDAIIIDLFDPVFNEDVTSQASTNEQKNLWNTLFQHLSNWICVGGPIVLYAGMTTIASKKQPYQQLMEMIQNSPLQVMGDIFHVNSIQHREIIPYKVFIPSFLGESVFLLLKSRTNTLMYESMKAVSHITKDVWKSYKTFNY